MAKLISIVLLKKSCEHECYEWWWEGGKRKSGIVIQKHPEKNMYALMFIVRGALTGDIKYFKRVSEALDYLRMAHNIDARIHSL